MEKLSKSELRDSIHKMLSIYQNYIKYQNINGLFDINTDCENIFCDLFNELYDLDLHNLNSQKHNYPAIDLADDVEEICIQITSQSKVAKITDTINSFEQNKMQDNYKELWIFILGEKRNYKEPFPDYVKIIDFIDLSKEVANCHNKSILNQIVQILHDELSELNLIDKKSASLLRNAENYEIILGNNYKSFFSYLGCAEDATQQDIDDINVFASQLADLNYELREVIYAGCKKQLKEKYGFSFIVNIRFNSFTVAAYLGDQQKVFNCYRQLNQLGYLRDDEDDIYYFTFNNRGNDYDILQSIANYCKNTKNDLKDILLNLDFRCLD